MSVRIRGTIDTDAKTFSFYLDIPNHGAGQGAICGGNTHVPEQFSWLIMEQGVWDDIEMRWLPSPGCRWVEDDLYHPGVYKEDRAKICTLTSAAMRVGKLPSKN